MTLASVEITYFNFIYIPVLRRKFAQSRDAQKS